MSDNKLRTVLVLFLVIVGLLTGATPGLAQEGEDDPGGFAGIVADLVAVVTHWYTDFICTMRAALMNAVGYWWCIECGFTEGGEGSPGGSWGCQEKPDCECNLCITWLGEYKELISDAIGWVVGAVNVFSLFIPWELWATLFTAYVTAASGLFAFRMVAKFGMWMFGATS